MTRSSLVPERRDELEERECRVGRTVLECDSRGVSMWRPDSCHPRDTRMEHDRIPERRRREGHGHPVLRGWRTVWKEHAGTPEPDVLDGRLLLPPGLHVCDERVQANRAPAVDAEVTASHDGRILPHDASGTRSRLLVCVLHWLFQGGAGYDASAIRSDPTHGDAER